LSIHLIIESLMIAEEEIRPLANEVATLTEHLSAVMGSPPAHITGIEPEEDD
jgi:hypothetical protein